MKTVTEIIAIIPARGGSQGIKKKNMQLLAGKPLLQHTINAALNSAYIDSVCVTSDDECILEFSKAQNVRIHKRSKESSTNEAPASSVVSEVIDSFEIKPSALIVYLQPTSPFRLSIHIDEAIKMLLLSSASSIISVVELKYSPYKSFKIIPSGRIEPVFSEASTNARRQDLPKCCYPNGAIYAFYAYEFNKTKTFPSTGAIPYFMSQIDSLDIDTMDDLILANKIAKEN